MGKYGALSSKVVVVGNKADLRQNVSHLSADSVREMLTASP